MCYKEIATYRKKGDRGFNILILLKIFYVLNGFAG